MQSFLWHFSPNLATSRHAILRQTARSTPGRPIAAPRQEEVFQKHRDPGFAIVSRALSCPPKLAIRVVILVKLCDPVELRRFMEVYAAF